MRANDSNSNNNNNIIYSGIRLGTDEMLRASYTPSPARRSSATPTPRRAKGTPSSTPKSKVTPAAGRKAGGDITDDLLALAPRKPVPEEPLSVNTDNLLNIGGSTANKRQRAQDFFMKPTDSS